MSLPWNLIQVGAKQLELDVDLVASLVMVESVGRAWATRFEPAYKNLVNVTSYARSRMVSEDTEATHQKMRWGYLQLLGAHAREFGFNGDLPELSRPSSGLRWGCTRLRMIVDTVGIRDLEAIISAWPTGKPQRAPDGSFLNQKYVRDVLRYYTQLNPPND